VFARPAVCLALGLTLWPPDRPAAAERRLASSPQELVLAEVEGLLARLGAQSDAPARPPPPGVQEERTPGKPARAFAGLALEESEVLLTGSPPAVLARLLSLARARQALGPPLSLEVDGPRLVLRARRYRLPRGARFDPQASTAELGALRDNLTWLEKRAHAARRLAVLAGSLADSEGVRLVTARLARDHLRVEGLALGPEAREGYVRLLTRRARALPRPPVLEFDGLRTLAWAPPDPGAVLQLSGAPLLEALAWLAPALGGQEYLAVEAGASPARLHLSVAALPQEAPLAALLARAGVPAVLREGVLLVPPPPAEAPAGAAPGRPFEVSLTRSPARDLLRGALDGHPRALMLGRGTERQVGALLRRLPAARVAGLTLAALGLEERRGPGWLLVLSPGERQGPVAGPAGAEPRGPVDLLALEVPAAALVAGLLGREELAACPAFADPLPQSFALQGVDPQELLRALLDALDRRVEGEALVPRTAASAPACRPGPPGPASPLRLAGLLRRPGAEPARLALLQDGGRLRWLGPGARLQDGRIVHAVGRRDVTLEDPQGLRERLRPAAAEAPGGRGLGAEQTRHALARLRLVGLARLPGRPAEALLLTPEGGALRARQGAPLGTRCGQVVRVGPEGLVVRLGCALEEEPRELRLGLEPDPR